METFDQIYKEKFIKMWHDGELVEKIAEECNTTVNGVRKRVLRYRSMGLIDDSLRPNYRGKMRNKNRVMQFNAPKKVYANTSNELPPTLDHPIECTLAVSKKCVYGCSKTSSYGSTPLCNYLLIVGHSRGCPHAECTKYVKATKENPKFNDRSGEYED